MRRQRRPSRSDVGQSPPTTDAGVLPGLHERIGVLGLGTRAYGCLMRAGIHTLEGLVQRRPRALLRIHNLGTATLKEIVDALEERGLKLGMNLEISPNPKADRRRKGKIGIKILELSHQSRICLQAGGIDTVEELTRQSPEELLKIPNISRKNVTEIVRKLKKRYPRPHSDYQSSEKIGTSEAKNDRKGIGVLGLSVRGLNCLRMAGVDTVGKLAQQSESQLLKIPNMGRKTVGEVVEALERRGVQLEPETAEYPVPRSGFPHDLQETLLPAMDTADEELRCIIDNVLPPRSGRIATARFGWSGDPIPTLETLGSDYAVTRERIRQIENKARAAIRHRFSGACPPKVLEALQFVTASSPIATKDVPQSLVKRGLSEIGLTFSALQTAADLFDTPWNVERVGGGDDEILVSTEDWSRPEYRQVYQALSSLGRNPFFDVNSLQNGMAEPSEAADIMVRLVHAHPTYAWLDEHAGVFWRIPRDPMGQTNKIIFVCRKLFSIAKRLHIDEVHGALQRARTVQSVPSKNALLEMLRQTGLFEYNGNDVVRKDGVTFSDLSGQDEQLLHAGRRFGTAVKFLELRNELVREGMSSDEAGLVIHQSPLLFRISHGTYRFLGGSKRDIPRKPVEQDQTQMQSDTVHVVEFRVTQRIFLTDKIRLEITVPERTVWTVIDSRNFEVGTCKTRKGVVSQIGKVLERLKAKTGDTYELRFKAGLKRVEIKKLRSSE